MLTLFFPSLKKNKANQLISIKTKIKKPLHIQHRDMRVGYIYIKKGGSDNNSKANTNTEMNGNRRTLCSLQGMYWAGHLTVGKLTWNLN